MFDKRMTTTEKIERLEMQFQVALISYGFTEESAKDFIVKYKNLLSEEKE